jgi:hypothetical protein
MVCRAYTLLIRKQELYLIQYSIDQHGSHFVIHSLAGALSL